MHALGVWDGALFTLTKNILHLGSALAQQITTGKNDLDVNLSEDNLRHHTENLRKDRDLLIIITALIYILNIIDAHVDAHLNTFDLTKSIALKFQPTYNCTMGETANIAISLKF